MYLDAHRYKMVTSLKNALYCVISIVSTVFQRNIHSDEILIRSPLKEVLYLDVGIAKYIFLT